MTRLEHLAPFAGIAAVALFVAEAIITGNTATVDDPAQTVVSYYSEHRGTQEAAAALFSLAAVSFVWFGASLRSAISSAGARAERLGSTAHSGTLLIAVGLAVYASVGLAAAHSVGKVPASSTQTLNVLNLDDMYVSLAAGAMLLVVSTALAVLRFGVLPRWIGWLSLVHGIVAVVALTAGPVADGGGFVGFLLLVAWVPIVSIALWRKASATGEPTPVDPARAT
jgi:hypothetical protein